MAAHVTAFCLKLSLMTRVGAGYSQRHRPYAVAAVHRPSGRGRRPRTAQTVYSEKTGRRRRADRRATL